MSHTSIHIKVFHPLIMLVVGHLFYLGLFIIAPIKIEYIPSTASILIYLIALFFLCLGLINGTKFKLYKYLRYNIEYNSKKLNFWLLFVALVIMFGILFRLYDRFYLRGLNLLMSSYERKELIEETNTSIFSILSSFIFPAGIFYYIILRLFKIRSKKLNLFGIILFIYPSFDVLLTGNRGVMIISLSIYIYYLFCFGEINKNKLKLIYIAAIGIISFVFSLYIFIDRISSYGFTPKYSANNSAYSYTLKPNKIANDLMENQNDFISTTVFACTNFSQYYLHGFFEWSYLFDHYSNYNHTYGALTFYIVAKFMSIVLDKNIVPDPQSTLPRFGVYTTFLGPYFIDFGIFVIAIMFLTGLIINIVWKRLIQYKILYFPIYCFLCTFLFFYPVVNFVQSALGLYLIFSFIFLYYLIKLHINFRVKILI